MEVLRACGCEHSNIRTRNFSFILPPVASESFLILGSNASVSRGSTADHVTPDAPVDYVFEVAGFEGVRDQGGEKGDHRGLGPCLWTACREFSLYCPRRRNRVS